MIKVSVKEKDQVNLSVKEARVIFRGIPSTTTVQADWDETNPNNSGYIKNKPSIEELTEAVQVHLDESVITSDGGEIEGNLSITSEPTEDNHVSTKKYVDEAVEQCVTKDDIEEIFNDLIISGGDSNG